MASLNIPDPASVTLFTFTDNLKASDVAIAAQIAKMPKLEKLVLRWAQHCLAASAHQLLIP